MIDNYLLVIRCPNAARDETTFQVKHRRPVTLTSDWSNQYKTVFVADECHLTVMWPLKVCHLHTNRKFTTSHYFSIIWHQWVLDGGTRRRGRTSSLQVRPADRHSRKICRKWQPAGVVFAEWPVIQASSLNGTAGAGGSKYKQIAGLNLSSG